MEKRHLNIKKVCAAALVFIMAFLIIIGSALITYNAQNDKNKDVGSVDREIIEDNIKPLIKNKVNKEDVNSEPSQEQSEEISNVESENSELIVDKKNELPLHTVENVYSGLLPKYNENSVAEIKAIYSSNEKQIFLTFDDGPTKEITPQILDILKEEQVPATFFVLGSRVELNPDLVKREFEEGHYIANHGYSHSYSTIYSSVQSVMDEYNATERAIQEAIGMSDYHSYLFRFPGGSSGGRYHDLKAEAKQFLANNGIASTNWNCLNGDAEASGRTEQELLTRLYESQGNNTSLIILMHDAYDKQATVNTLREVITHYKSEGYTFKNFYDIF